MSMIQSKTETEVWLKNLVIPIDRLGLSIRSENCLKRINVDFVGDLVLKTDAELLSLRNFGWTCLNEIKVKLSKMNLYLGMSIPDWSSNDIEEGDRSYSGEVKRKIRTEAIQNSQKIVSRFTKVEDELLYLAIGAGSERNRQIVMSHFGWDGCGVKTLKKIGNEVGLTRERVRQIVGMSIRRIEWRMQRDSISCMPMLNRALDFVSGQMPKLARSIEAELTTAGLTGKPFRIEGLQTSGGLLGRRIPFRIVVFKGRRFVVPSELPEAPKLICSIARKTIRQWGVSTISDIIGKVEEKTGQWVRDDFVISVLSLMKGFAFLDKSLGWFWLSSVQRNRLLNQIQKVLSVAGQIDISELRGGIARHHRMQGLAPPRSVLLELCRRLPWCRVTGTKVTADPPLNWKNILFGTNEWAMALILAEHGPVLSRVSFEEMCLELGVNRNSFSVLLGSSPIIKKHAVGVYGLRGIRISYKTIESLKGMRVSGSVLKDFGWTSEGKIWIALKLSQEIISTGVFTVPATIREFLQGPFSLRTLDGALIGNLNIRDSGGSSLSSFFRRRGGEPDDYLMLIFDLSSRSAIVNIGEHNLLDDFVPDYQKAS